MRINYKMSRLSWLSSILRVTRQTTLNSIQPLSLPLPLYLSTSSWQLVPKLFSTSSQHRLISKEVVPHVCIVGSGPAGFYTAMQLIKSHKHVRVDLYEKLAVPYGLVRYGVAPDHPEVKNCITSFQVVANKERCNFLGNISIGTDVTVPELQRHYHAVVLASGAYQDRRLDIPGEERVVSARQLVGWYNGLPQDAWLKPKLDEAEHAVVVGHGNVAIDVARMLLTHVDKLKPLDIPEAVLAHLACSRVRRVTLVGRRGPQHVAFTIKEFREMTRLPDVGHDIRPSDCTHLPNLMKEAKRPRRRLLELLHNTASASEATLTQPRQWGLRFLRSPMRVIPDEGDAVEGLEMTVNRLSADGLRAEPTEDTETLPCQLVLRSVGYVGTRFDSSLPYDEHTGVIINTKGRVAGMAGVYAVGWAANGPVGVIVNTMSEGFACAKTVLADLRDGLPLESKDGSYGVLPLLQRKGVAVVSLSGAAAILDEEHQAGQQLGKLSEFWGKS